MPSLGCRCDEWPEDDAAPSLSAASSPDAAAPDRQAEGGRGKGLGGFLTRVFFSFVKQVLQILANRFSSLYFLMILKALSLVALVEAFCTEHDRFSFGLVPPDPVRFWHGPCREPLHCLLLVW